MKFFAEKRNKRTFEGGNYMLYEHRGLERHVPPHERRALMHIEFDEDDWKLMKKVFGDEDTAAAASEIITEAPPEIQILAVQLMNIIKEAD